MTHLFGRAPTGSTHLWNGTRWTNGPDNVILDNNTVRRQVLGWAMLADTRYDLSSVVFSGVAGSNFTGAFWSGNSLWLCDNGTGTDSVYRLTWDTDAPDLVTSTASIGFTIDPYDIFSSGDFVNVFFSSYSTNQVVYMNGSFTSSGTTISLTSPRRFAYDGEKLWVSRETVITRINSLAPSTTNLTGFTFAEYMVFDGRYLWVADQGASNIVKVDPYPTTPVKVTTLSLASRPMGITFDGTSVWSVSDTGEVVYKINTVTGVVTTIDVSSWLTSPTLITFDGYTVVVADSSNHIRLNPNTGRPLRGTTYTGGGSNFLITIGPGSMLIGNGTSVKRGDLPLSGTFLHLARDTSTSDTIGIGVQGNGGIWSTTPVPTGTTTYDIGTTGTSPQLMPASAMDAQIIKIVGNLSGNVRIDPVNSGGGTNTWHVYHDVTLNGNSLTFGSLSSSVSLGAQGTHSLILRVDSSGTYVIANQY